MTDELLINVNEFETRAALMCGGSLLELHIARSRGYSLTGNIYLGRVQRVVPGMQAAFVDIGLERPGFLHARDMRRREAAAREAAVREPAAREAGEETFPDIRDLAAAGQSLLVQIVKDP
ncbi:MAG: S1 RNA-binding domain-containing protein, partial [Gammaproteobacteria bacterium]|nr:S1 RNA-binding domain-containing protein [Gammaproteobacteria bacterium]